jgi:hypothetical protein
LEPVVCIWSPVAFSSCSVSSAMSVSFALLAGRPSAGGRRTTAAGHRPALKQSLVGFVLASAGVASASLSIIGFCVQWARIARKSRPAQTRCLASRHFSSLAVDPPFHSTSCTLGAMQFNATHRSRSSSATATSTCRAVVSHRPNPSIERTRSGLRPPRAAHVKR